MRHNLEREVKLQAPVGFLLPDLPGTPAGPRRFTSTYFDTEDLRLAGHGITLRRRVENRRGLWQLKIPQGKRDRREVEEPGGPSGPPRSLSALLVASLRGAKLIPVAKLRTVRTGVMVVSAGGRRVAEVALDAVQALNGTRVVKRFTEIEVELLDGDESDLQATVAILKSAGAYTGDERAKALQVLDLGRPGKVDRRPESDLAQVQAFIQEQFDAIVGHDAGTRVGADPEDLHQQRVGIRKLRSLLRAADLLDPQWSAWLGRELEWIGDALNPVRDLDVMIPYLSEDLGLLPAEDSWALRPLLTHLRAEHTEARERMLEALESDRYLQLLDTVEEATRSIKVRPCDAELRSGAVRRFAKLRKAVRNLPEPPGEEELHRVRRLAKKARYAAEIVLPGEGKAAAVFMKKMKVLQDLLGDLQDASVAEGRIRGYLPHAQDPQTSFALGRLAELQAAKKRNAKARFGPAWKAVNRSGKKAWM
ncbi:MAG: CYTH and CHAD domain-containing protein [Actinomycetota bacterium]